MDISNSSEGEDQPPEVVHNNITNRKGIPQRLLLPPVIEATGLLATGATTEVLRKQNKHQRIMALLRQPVASQWTIHKGNNILPTNHWGQLHKMADDLQMAPQGLALRHEASGLLSEWEQFGCPTRTGCDWAL
jgi:hypothetical protein